MDTVPYFDESSAKHASDADAWRRSERVSSGGLVSFEWWKRVESPRCKLLSAVVSVAAGFAYSQRDRSGWECSVGWLVGCEANLSHTFSLRKTNCWRGRNWGGGSSICGFAATDFAGEFGGVWRLHILSGNEFTGCPSLSSDSWRRNDILDFCRSIAVLVSIALFRWNAEWSENWCSLASLAGWDVGTVLRIC